MLPDNQHDRPEDLLRELQALQQLLDSSGDENDNIPILSEKISLEIPAVVPVKKAENPFLPQAVLDRLSHERMAAQQSAEEAHRTMQRVNDQKQQRARNVLGDIGKTLSPQQKDQLVQQLVEEMLPQIAERLKEKLKVMLNR